MLKNLIPHPDLITAFTGRDESLADLEQLPELKDHQFVSMEQVHSNEAKQLDSKVKKEIKGTDAVLTTDRTLALTVRVADCVPLLLYHEPSQTIGVIHAGRKSTELGLTEKTLQQLPTTEGTLHIWLGPHICEQCYQINEELNEHYNLLRKNIDQMYQVFDRSNLNLIFANQCTAHHNKLYYSYRKEGVGVPMNYGVIAFKA